MKNIVNHDTVRGELVEALAPFDKLRVNRNLFCLEIQKIQ